MRRGLTRRAFLAGSACAAAVWAQTAGKKQIRPHKNALPRWRGFNLLNFFQALSRGETGDCTVRELDLKWIRDWGFDFVRLPMDWWLWIDSDWRKTRRLKPSDAYKINERILEKVDRAVELCMKYGLHISLNFHRAPGYCINNPQREPFVLWKDKEAEDAFVYHWDLFAKRYRAIGPQHLSFNLLNEAPRPRPGYMTREDYRRIMTRAAKKIWETTPDRIVIVDGLNVGTSVVEELVPLGVAQSVHAYKPAQLSHFRARWVDRRGTFPTPTWPLRRKDGKVIFDRKGLERYFAPWADLVRRGIGVHCGECGCYNKTPHKVFLAWLSDVLDILTNHGIGYALWNFRGSFGVLDSGRRDVAYEDWYGHKLDRKLLDLLRRH